MKKLLSIVFLIVFAVYLLAQKTATTPLRLLKSTPLPGVDGDFDHFAADVRGDRLFLAGEDHKTVEVFNLHSGKHLRSISGFETPHSMLYLPDSNQLLVIDGGDGTVKVLKGNTYEVEDKIKLNRDADSIGYDPEKKQLYVDNGGKDAQMDYSLISIIDTNSKKRVGDIRIESDRIEAMAVEKSGSRLFLNNTGKAQVDVIDREKKAVMTSWPVPDAKENVPMALDEADHRLFVVTRKPPKLFVFDTESGKVVTSLPANGRADDMSYDPSRKRIYVAAGEGFVNVYQQKDRDTYEAVGKIPTGPVAKIGTFVPELNRYYVAVSSKDNQPAKVMIFDAQP